MESPCRVCFSTPLTRRCAEAHATHARLMRLKQSFCLPCFHKPDGDLPALLKAAAQIGFAACEIWYRDETIDRIAALAKENGLVLASMCGHRDWRNGLNRRENHDRIEGELATSIDVAVRLGIPGLICF